MKTFILFATIFFSLQAASITNFRLEHFCIKSQKNQFFIYRSFLLNNTQSYLALNTTTLETKILKSPLANPSPCNYDSRYFQLLHLEINKPYPLQNDGFIQSKNGIIITTDLCPSSKKGFEKRLYKALFQNFPNPVPVTLFITKRWIIKHKKAFHTLLLWEKERKLSITWGNHTAYHHYFPKRPLKENFVLAKNENLVNDVTNLEITLLEHGITPSIFFRFPGLVSNKKSALTIASLGYIIVGSNTWLAKGEKLKQNSIILVHGNKNEAKGVDILLKLIKEKRITQISDIKSAF